MISIPEPIKSTVLPRPASSSTGPFHTLPTELLHIILNSLDFRSLSRFSRVCHQAKTIVESLPSYQCIMKHASTTLIALSRTRLIKFHTAASLYAALLSDECVSCQKYAAFLFLPTCERCCYKCLREDPSLRVITLRMAQVCYRVSRNHLRRIPIMLNIPGGYGESHKITCLERVRLVSVKQAERLAMSVYGSQEAIDSADLSENYEETQFRRLCDTLWLEGSSTSHKIPDDKFCGMASISFPSLRPNVGLENGLWCFGCRINSQNCSKYEMYNYTQLHPSDTALEDVLLGMERQERSRSEFLEHIRDCKGAKNLLRGGEILSRYIIGN